LVRLSKPGGLSDADEILAIKLRDQGIVTTTAALKDLLKAGGVTAFGKKAGLVHST
jgi:hypothetical protein